MEESLKACGLCKSYYGRSVVQSVNIEVFPGEVVGLLGPNGAGKTTTFYMIVGLVKADEGNISLRGEDITEWAVHKRAHNGMGYLPQEASIFRELTVEENIYGVLEYRKMNRRERDEKLEELMKSFGIETLRKSKGRELSGGERRRVEIARTLALGPSFILLDEPFAGVDPLAVSDIQAIIRGLKRRKIGVLITDHSVRETLDIVDRAYIMNNGELLVHGTPKEILSSERARELYLGQSFKM